MKPKWRICILSIRRVVYRVARIDLPPVHHDTHITLAFARQQPFANLLLLASSSKIFSRHASHYITSRNFASSVMRAILPGPSMAAARLNARSQYKYSALFRLFSSAYHEPCLYSTPRISFCLFRGGATIVRPQLWPPSAPGRSRRGATIFSRKPRTRGPSPNIGGNARNECHPGFRSKPSKSLILRSFGA